MCFTSRLISPVRLCLVLIAAVGLSQSLTAAELGSYESELQASPSYAAYLDAGLYLGASPGLGASGVFNVNSILSGLLPFMNSLPKIYLDASVSLLSVNATALINKAMGEPYTGQDPTIGALMGFGGQGFRALVGLDLFQKTKIVSQQWMVSRSETSRSVTTRYYPIKAPMITSTILMAGVSYERSGQAWIPPVDEFDDPVLQDGYQPYWQARLRFQELRRFTYTATALGGVKRVFRSWNYYDLIGIASFDLQQYGGGFSFASIGGLFSFKAEFGCVYRRGVPGGDLIDSLYMPICFSMGVGGMPLPLNKNDRYWNSRR